MLSFRVLLLKYVRQTIDVQSQENYSPPPRHKLQTVQPNSLWIMRFHMWLLETVTLLCDLCEFQVLFPLIFSEDYSLLLGSLFKYLYSSALCWILKEDPLNIHEFVFSYSVLKTHALEIPVTQLCHLNSFSLLSSIHSPCIPVGTLCNKLIHA